MKTACFLRGNGFTWMKVKVLVAQSFLTLGDPMDCSPSGSSIHGILQARILEWVAIPFSRLNAVDSCSHTGSANCIRRNRGPTSVHWAWSESHNGEKKYQQGKSPTKVLKAEISAQDVWTAQPRRGTCQRYDLQNPGTKACQLISQICVQAELLSSRIQIHFQRFSAPETIQKSTPWAFKAILNGRYSEYG